jgi:hypothetical protein
MRDESCNPCVDDNVPAGFYNFRNWPVGARSVCGVIAVCPRCGERGAIKHYRYSDEVWHEVTRSSGILVKICELPI